jgi:hypothetical protein
MVPPAVLVMAAGDRGEELAGCLLLPMVAIDSGGRHLCVFVVLLIRGDDAMFCVSIESA